MTGVFLAATFLCCLVLLSACGASKSGKSCSAYIEIQPAGGNAAVRLPYFYPKKGEPTDELNRLNDVIDDVRHSYERTQEEDSEQYSVISEKTEGTRYLVTSMYITDDWVTLTGRSRRERDIVTLAYDQKEDRAITSTEALESTGITGVQLSEKADEQLQKLQKTDLQYAGNLRSTEMQGFSLDADGTVNDIYMKLEIDTGKEDPESFFFHFDPKDSTLVPLAWPEESDSE